MAVERDRQGNVRIVPLTGSLEGSIRPPGSKSLTNRAVLCAALAEGESFLTGVLDSEDTRVMVNAWKALGLDIEWRENDQTLRISGCGGQPPVRDVDLFIANSGTSMRFLTAALATCRGRYRLSGVPRMHQRPVRDLVDGLRQLGGQLRSMNDELPDCPPVLIESDGLLGGRAAIPGNVSSQFLSGLLMAAPYARSKVEIQVDGDLVSKPYVAMTIQVMKEFGIDIEVQEGNRFRIDAPRRYRGVEYAIEPDASAASYFWAMAAITGGGVVVEGLSLHALQGDVEFCHVLERMGCQLKADDHRLAVRGGPLQGIDVDMSNISDTVQTLAVVALFADGTTRIRGVGHNRHKETDRIGDLATELRKLGATVDEFDDGLAIAPGALHGAMIETYNDHRMAMSLSLVGLRVPDVWITNPQCTEKTYPNFFDDVERLLG